MRAAFRTAVGRRFPVGVAAFRSFKKSNNQRENRPVEIAFAKNSKIKTLLTGQECEQSKKKQSEETLKCSHHVLNPA
ncbi:hypothetical protein [Lentibacillus amyloliquefaciens]|nr:hypothetical protein [Lentibacillus amyloliquefaciens]